MLQTIFTAGAIVLSFAICGLSEAREWKTKTGEQITGELESGSPGRVHLRQPNGRLAAVALDSLSPVDQRYARDRLGMALVDMTGFWKTGLGSYYYISLGKDNKYYARLLQSETLSSVEGVLSLKNKRIVSEQWSVVFKTPPGHKRDLRAQIFLGNDGSIHTKFDFVNLNQVISTETGDFFKVDEENAPASVIKAYLDQNP
jgi:hypothetical protein